MKNRWFGNDRSKKPGFFDLRGRKETGFVCRNPVSMKNRWFGNDRSKKPGFFDLLGRKETGFVCRNPVSRIVYVGDAVPLLLCILFCKTLRKCHTTCVVFEVRSSALALKMALKRYYKPDLICQLRQFDSVAKLLGLKMALKRYYKPDLICQLRQSDSVAKRCKNIRKTSPTCGI